MSERFSCVRGTRDLLPEAAVLFTSLEQRARAVLERYGYREIRTPVFEFRDLFARSLGESTDVVEKEMYVFEDRGGRSLALRPEGTAGVVRAYIQNHLDRGTHGTKLYYLGPMFRAERPQAGRYREFWQIGAEYFGSGSPLADAEIFVLMQDLLHTFGLSSFEARLNSLGCEKCRPGYQRVLKDYINRHHSKLCEECRKRVVKNPLRALDCKVDSPLLKQAPQTMDFLCLACQEHFQQVRILIGSSGYTAVLFPRLVRGLDYYTRTVFEIVCHELGAQDAVAAGGRYDRLIQNLGGSDVPAVGFALGMDRIIQILGKQQETLGKVKTPDIYVVTLGNGAFTAGFTLVQKLRAAGLHGEVGQKGKSLKAQLRAADSLGARMAILLGESELAQGKAIVKDLEQHTQEEVALDRIVDWVVQKRREG